MSLDLRFPICQVGMLCSNLSVDWEQEKKSRCAPSVLLNIGGLSADPLAPAARHQRPVFTTGPYDFPNRMFLPKVKLAAWAPDPQTKKLMKMLVTEDLPETKCPREVVSERLGTALSGKDKQKERRASNVDNRQKRI